MHINLLIRYTHVWYTHLQYKDILQLMIEATGCEDGEAGGEKESAVPPGCPAHKATKGTMTNEEVVEHSIAFLIAGNETTATTLSFGSYLLALHPDIQEKLQSEIDTYFDDKPVSALSVISHLSLVL